MARIAASAPSQPGDPSGQTRLESARHERGFSQRTLAEAADTTRQAVGAIESGRMQPSVGIALRLARALGTSVEELFTPMEAAQLPPSRVATGTVAGRTVHHALVQDHLSIEPAESAVPTVFIGGCELSAGLLSRHATARSREMRALWLTMTNHAALAALGRGSLHAAVVHGIDERRPNSLSDVVAFEIATTEAGWLFARGNPLGLRGASDLAKKKARFVNRPAGAGARRLLDAELRRAKLDPVRIDGYERELAGQLDAGRAVAQNFADAAIGLASVGRLFGADFVPLREERCALVVPAARLDTPEIRFLLAALRSAPYRRDLEAQASYDVARTGERIA